MSRWPDRNQFVNVGQCQTLTIEGKEKQSPNQAMAAGDRTAKRNGSGIASKQKPNRKEVKSVDSNAQHGAQLFEPVRKRVLMHVNLLKEQSPKVRLAPQSSPRISGLQVSHRTAVKATIPYDCHGVNNSVAANKHKFLRALHHVDVHRIARQCMDI